MGSVKEVLDNKSLAERNVSIKSNQLSVTIDGICYDITEFAKRHPGGQIITKMNGRDATEAFYALHDKSYKARAMIRQLPIIRKEVVKTKEEARRTMLTNDLEELRNKLHAEGYYETSSIIFFLRLVPIVLLFFGGFIAAKNFGLIVGGVCLGIAWGSSGFLMHDCGHLSTFATRKMNIIFQNFLLGYINGASATWWRARHNVHHVVTNEDGRDPDLRTTPILTWHASTAKHQPTIFLKIQAYIFLPSLSLYMWVWRLSTFRWMFYKRKYMETLIMSIHYTTLYVLFAYYLHYSFGQSLAYYSIAAAVQGILLGWIFALNHFARPLVKNPETLSWLEAVSISTQNIYGNSVYNYFQGFLNYQIEHHLFPQIPSYNYPLIAPKLKALFEKHKIPYITKTFLDASMELFTTLWTVGKDPQNKY